MEKKKTQITFKMNTVNSVYIMRDGKMIGRIWSQQEDGTTPFPHEQNEYCLNSVQFCGFDRISEIWGCGPFQGKKDCVMHFVNTDNEYHKNKETKYRDYIRNIINLNRSVLEIQSFDDWNRHHL